MRHANLPPRPSDFLRRRMSSFRSASALAAGEKIATVNSWPRPTALASDAFLIPLCVTNFFFFVLFFVSGVFLMGRWRDKIRNSTSLHILSSAEIASTVAFLASVIYLLDFFGIILVQSLVARPHDDDVADFIPPQCRSLPRRRRSTTLSPPTTRASSPR